MCAQKISLECISQYSLIQENAQRTHRLLEGDNIFSLQYLVDNNERFDVIYIDPPYNTGTNDFVYNDRYVNTQGLNRHSGWLDFMKPRLEYAHTLLDDKGFIAVSIDDREMAYLKVLLDDVFGEQNFIANIVWQSRTSVNDSKHIGVLTEYILMYAKNIKNLSLTKKATPTHHKFTDEFVDTRGGYVLDVLDRGSLSYSPSLDYPMIAPDGTVFYAGSVSQEEHEKRKSNPVKRKDWQWRWSQKTVNNAINNGQIVFKKGKTGAWRMYAKQYEKVDRYLNPITRENPYSNVLLSSDVSNGEGTLDIKKVLGGRPFSYPKPVRLVKHFVNLHPNKNARVLDFFAGSGTTGQAVLELNHEDNGSRVFTLCTNNFETDGTENGIARNITAPRVHNVLTGQWADGKKHVSYPQDSLEYYMVSVV